MDYGFIKALLRADFFPPSDPWYAGSSLSYYYGGHLIIAILTLFSRTPPFIAYNIGVAMFFALTVLASYGIGYNLTHRNSYGLLTALFITFIGFLSGLFQLIAFFFPESGSILDYQLWNFQSIVEWFSNYRFYEINRIIPNTLNFYPGFVFLQGDVHGHMTSIPFQVAFISFIYGNIVLGTNTVNKIGQIANILIMGVFLGFFLLINTWNYPAYMIFTGSVIALETFRDMGSDINTIFSEKIPIFFSHFGMIAIISVIFYFPYLILSSSGGFKGIAMYGGKTHLLEFLEIFLLFIFILGTLLLCLIRNDPKTMAGITLLSVILAWISGFQILLILIPIILISIISIKKTSDKNSASFSFILLLAIVGSILALFCDFFFISDSYNIPNNRMNTVMKIYLEIWVFLGIASANALYFILRRSPVIGTGNKFSIGKTIWTIILSILIISSLISPVGMSMTLISGKETIYGKLPYFDTLNGLDYLFDEHPWDLIAIDWIDQNITGNPIMVEAPGDAYKYSSRVSALTGLPTVIGWENHELMWRGMSLGSDIKQRQHDVHQIYDSKDNEETLELLKKYNIAYIYVGELEREKYSREGLQKFYSYPEDYKMVYCNDEVSIFNVNY